MSYDSTNRLRAVLTLLQPNAGSWVQNYGYDNLMRLSALASPAGTFAYTYPYNTAIDRPQEIQFPNGADVQHVLDNFARVAGLY